jgi:hypothetical protein
MLLNRKAKQDGIILNTLCDNVGSLFQQSEMLVHSGTWRRHRFNPSNFKEKLFSINVLNGMH